MTRIQRLSTAFGLSFLLATTGGANAGARTTDPFATPGGIWTVTSPCALDGIGFIEGGMAMIYYKGDGDAPGGAAFYSFTGAAFTMNNLSANAPAPAFKSFSLGGALRPDGTLAVVHGYTAKGSPDRKREQCVLKREAQ